jgi:hypothetical protein
MSERDDDIDLLRAWREAPRVMPDERLDGKVLANAQAWRLRRRLVPLMALAACLALGVFGLQRSAEVLAPPSPPAANTARVESRAAVFLMKVDVAGPALAAPAGALDGTR